ncbi:MAG TPA: hypothetical protein VF940_06815 [Streptosporangiaceae bacterium]
MMPEPAAATRLVASLYVNGRGISAEASVRASAVASLGPIQIGRLRSPPRSARIMMCSRWAGSSDCVLRISDTSTSTHSTAPVAVMTARHRLCAGPARR